MSRTMSRKRFLRQAAAGGGAVVAASVARPTHARAAAALDATYDVPYQPHPVIAYPSSWFVFTALLPHVLLPYDVIVCNRELGPLPDIQGYPDLRAVPDDATMLLLFIQEPIPSAQTADNFPSLDGAVTLTGTTMQFSDLGSGEINYAGFRNFIGWYVATVDESFYSISVNVYVGPNAGPEWTDVQGIVNSIHIPD